MVEQLFVTSSACIARVPPSHGLAWRMAPTRRMAPFGGAPPGTCPTAAHRAEKDERMDWSSEMPNPCSKPHQHVQLLEAVETLGPS